jgi:hypothetical protein
VAGGPRISASHAVLHFDFHYDVAEQCRERVFGLALPTPVFVLLVYVLLQLLLLFPVPRLGRRAFAWLAW